MRDRRAKRPASDLGSNATRNKHARISQGSASLANSTPQLAAALQGLLNVPAQLQDIQGQLLQLQQDANRNWNATCGDGVFLPFRPVRNQAGDPLPQLPPITLGPPPPPPPQFQWLGQELLALNTQQLNAWLAYYFGPAHQQQHFGPAVPDSVRRQALARQLNVRCYL
eukprot:tig00001057_g6688.t1